MKILSKKPIDRQTCYDLSIEDTNCYFAEGLLAHNTNASICKNFKTQEVWCQSRETIITPESDNAGFARYCAENEEVFNKLINIYDEPNGIISIYGEWCGKGIMKGVGINALEKMFVVFGVKYSKNVEDIKWIDIEQSQPITGQTIVGSTADYNTWEETWGEVADEPLGQMKYWIAASDYPHPIWMKSSFSNLIGDDQIKKLNDNRIFDIEQFPTFDVTIDFANADKSVDLLMQLTDRIEAQCPVAFALGATGIGEGLVWKCSQSWLGPYGGVIKTSDLLFKTKGLKHKESASDKPSADPIKVANVQKFVDGVATVHRFEKMVEKLEIAGVDIKRENTGQFLKLVGEDIIREEGDVLTVSGLDRKAVMGVVNNVAKHWWISLVDSKPL